MIRNIPTFSVKPKGVIHDGSGSISIHFQEEENFKKLYSDAINLYGKDFLVKKQVMGPHLSLTKLINESDVKTCMQDIKKVTDDIRIKYLAICVDGDFGTCTKIIKKYRFSYESPSLKAMATKDRI